MIVLIREHFTGYPDGTLASERLFHEGDCPDLPAVYAQMLVAKGHALACGPRLPVLPPEAVASPSPTETTTP